MPKPKGNNKKNVMPVFRIFCEGEKTEPYYIRGYVNNFHSDKRSIIVVENTNKNTPVQLVDVAVESKCGGHEADWIWVVYDRESEAKYSDSLHAEARKKAKDNNINIAFSNVCFEFWLLIHFEYTTAGYTSCDDLLHNSRLREKLSSIGIKDYEKGLPTLFDKLKDKVNDAMKNSEKLKIEIEKSAEKDKMMPHKINPYLDIHEMFIDMDNFINKRKRIREA